MTVPEFRLGVSSVADSAIAQIDSTTRGFLIPRMTTTQRDAISSPAASLLIYNTTTSAFNAYIGGSWVALGGSAGNAPADATYITQTASSGLSAEQALSSLSTGLMKVTTATGVISSITDSAGLAGVISDETGTGALVFAAAPTLSGVVAITSTFADPVATTRALNLQATQTLTGASAIRIDGALIAATLSNGTSNNTNATGTIGANVSTTISGSSGTVTSAIGALVGVTATGGVTLTSGYGLRLSAASAASGSTITSYAGWGVGAQTSATNNTYILLGTTTIPSGNWCIYAVTTNDSSLAGKLGLGNNFAPTNTLSLTGQSAQTMWMERHTTGNTAGNSLTVQSGGATSGATDKSSGNLILSPGVHTGNALPGVLNLKGYAKVAATGTGDATQIDRVFGFQHKVLTNNSATTILNATLASLLGMGVIIRYMIEVTNGTDSQVEVGEVFISGVNKGGAFTMTINELNSQQSLSSGATLATTWAVSSADPAAVSINANSSLTSITSGYPLITYYVENYSRQALAVA